MELLISLISLVRLVVCYIDLCVCVCVCVCGVCPVADDSAVSLCIRGGTQSPVRKICRKEKNKKTKVSM